MAGTIALANFRIVLRALVDVLDHERDRRAGRDEAVRCRVLEHAGEYLHLIRLAALRGEARLAGAALVEKGLYLGLGDRNPRRTAIDNAADRKPVAFAPGGDAEEMAEGVMRHSAPADVTQKDFADPYFVRPFRNAKVVALNLSTFS